MKMIVVGGVPGAGKSTAILRYAGTSGVWVLDPDRFRPRLRRRWLVHLVHQALLWSATLLGPRVGTLLVQDTSTRRRRREALLRMARWRGWDVHLVLVEVSRDDALAGQAVRGRLTPAPSFERHWNRWLRLRADLADVAVPPEVANRRDVAAVVDRLVADSVGRRGVGPDPEPLLGPSSPPGAGRLPVCATLTVP
ncbi:MAG: AAA family ATPase [Candidatus Nanopelagicales bacterium]